MRTKAVFSVGLVIAGLCVVAIVRAQDADSSPSSRRTDTGWAAKPIAQVTDADAPADKPDDVPLATRRYGNPTPAAASPAGAKPLDRKPSDRKPSESAPSNAAQHNAPSTIRGTTSRQSSLAERLQSIRNGIVAEQNTAPAQSDAAPAQSNPAPAQSNPAPAQSNPAQSPAEPKPLRTLPETMPAARPTVVRPALIGVERHSVLNPSSAEPRVADASAGSAPRVTHDASPVGATLLANESPVLSVNATGPKTISVGKRATYVITLANRGSSPAKGVQMRVTLPESAEITGNTTTTGIVRIEADDARNSVVLWQISEVPAGGKEQLNLDLIPRDNRPVDLAVDWTFTPMNTHARIEVLEPKLELALTGPEEVLFGETKVYTITVSNPGTGDAENVVLNLLSVQPDRQPAGSRDVGTIPAGGRKVIEVELTAREPGMLHVRTQARADGQLADDAALEVMVRQAILEVAVDGPPVRYAGTNAEYKVRIINSGDATARDVVASVKLPGGAKFLAATEGGKFDPETGQVQWTVGSLRPDDLRVFDVQCVLNQAGQNHLTIRSEGAGGLKVGGEITTAVEALADLKLVVNDPQGPIEIGKEVVYEVRLVNRGTKTAENINVVGFFSKGIDPISTTGGRANIDLAEGEVVFEPVARIDAGEERTFQIKAKASLAGNHIFRAEVTCTNPDTRLAGEESTRFYGNQPAGPAAGEGEQGITRRPAPPQAETLKR